MLIPLITISFLLTFIILLLIVNTDLKHLVSDTPNHRSLHQQVVPRSGGLAIMAGVLITWSFYSKVWLWSGLVLILVVVSLMDDIKGLSVKWRFLIQIIVSSLFLYFAGAGLYFAMSVFILFCMVWMVNLYNFMDGSDGLAGGMAIIGFGTYGVAAYLAQDNQMVLMNASLVSATLAFLIFNFHPAKIFMGDGGSIPLGFLAASIGFYGWQHGLWTFWFPVLVFSPFIVDATVTLFKRAARGKRIWEAHRSHYYQRLVQMGWGHRKTAAFEYILMLAVAISALLLNRSDSGQALVGLAIWSVIYAIILVMIDIHWKRFSYVIAHSVK